jgi:hypothetical protein
MPPCIDRAARHRVGAQDLGSDALVSRRVRHVLLGSYPVHAFAEGSPIVASAKFVVYKPDLLDDGEVKRSQYSRRQGHGYRPDETRCLKGTGR